VSEALVDVVIALGDDELVLGHRHSEWTGFAPHIEEDVAFSSIAQDEIGHAAAYYGIVAAATGDDPDRLGLGREPHEYHNAILCERPNRDWAYTLARHWLYDIADDVRLESLERSSSKDIAALATKLRREERYHLIHADAWMKRVSKGPIEGRTRLIDWLTDAFEEALGLFEPVEKENAAIEQGVLPVSFRDLREQWLGRVAGTLDDLGLPTDIRARLDESAEFLASSSGDLIASDGEGEPTTGHSGSGLGGRRGRHSEDFAELWTVMTRTYREHEGATW
jgi:ring-1,2-phenylacetyl-CoA epoxidase subunit PaaC